MARTNQCWPSSIGTGSVELKVERASLTARLTYVSNLLSNVVDMGRALAGPFSDGKCAEESTAIVTVVMGLHDLVDEITCKAEAIEGQLKTLTNEL